MEKHFKHFWQVLRRSKNQSLEPASGKVDRAPRLQLESFLHFRGLGEFGWSMGKTENISVSGVLFRSGRIMEPNTQVEMSLLPPKEVVGEASGSVYRRGRVARTVLPISEGADPSLAVSFSQKLSKTESTPDVRQIIGDDRGPLSNQ